METFDAVSGPGLAWSEPTSDEEMSEFGFWAKIFSFLCENNTTESSNQRALSVIGRTSLCHLALIESLHRALLAGSPAAFPRKRNFCWFD